MLWEETEPGESRRREAMRSSGGAAGGATGNEEEQIKAFLDGCGLSEYHELFLKAGRCTRMRHLTRCTRPQQIRVMSRRLPAFRRMTTEQHEQVAAAVKAGLSKK